MSQISKVNSVKHILLEPQDCTFKGQGKEVRPIDIECKCAAQITRKGMAYREGFEPLDNDMN